jgi:3-carboxy-cis,cis-muconate cycloisomerase
VVDRFAAELDLPVPILPWHAERAPVARLAAALGRLAGATGKAARDLVLLAQPEVAEVAERDEPGRGVSSAMPGKRNPVAGVAAIAAARRARPLAAELATALDHEHERAAGAWQAEAPMLCDLWRHTGRAVAALADALDGLVVDEARMAANAGEGAPDFGQIDRLITGALTRTGTSVAR